MTAARTESAQARRSEGSWGPEAELSRAVAGLGSIGLKCHTGALPCGQWGATAGSRAGALESTGAGGTGWPRLRQRGPGSFRPA